MRLAAVLSAALLSMNVVTADRAMAFFFDYEEPLPPVSGDCGAIAAAIGPEATWHGEFIGKRVDEPSDAKVPYSARGCFKSKTACWIFLNQALTYAGRGELLAMYCRQGVRSY